MNRIPRLLVLLCLLVLPLSCSTPPAPPPGMAIIRPMGLRNTQSRTYTPRVVLREIDGRALSDLESEAAVSLPPGPHSITVTMYSRTGSSVGNMAMGPVGQAIGNAIDMIHSVQFESQLRFIAEAGHTYRACVLDDGRGYRFWIEDEMARRVVAGAKHW
jgi:hypothetical protein